MCWQEVVTFTAKSPAAQVPPARRTNMNRIATHWLKQSLAAFAAATLLTACAEDDALGPDQGLTSSMQMAAATEAVATGAAFPNVDLGVCDNLSVPTDSKLAFHVYASGVQIYRWNGTSWSFIAPDAQLFADAGGQGQVGTHYAGPTWESVNGGKVYGAVLQRCTPDASAVPWLLLAAVSEGAGIFERVTFIQRINTVGGIAPATPGSVIGEEARVAYTTEYLFYRPQ
jgi:hypothetical protein